MTTTKDSYNIMRKLFAKSVAVRYSLLGRKGKLKFGSLPVYSTIVGNMFYSSLALCKSYFINLFLCSLVINVHGFKLYSKMN